MYGQRLFAKSFLSSLHQSKHKGTLIGLMILIKMLTIHGERNGDNDRYHIQSICHQTE